MIKQKKKTTRMEWSVSFLQESDDENSLKSE